MYVVCSVDEHPGVAPMNVEWRWSAGSLRSEACMESRRARTRVRVRAKRTYPLIPTLIDMFVEECVWGGVFGLKKKKKKKKARSRARVFELGQGCLSDCLFPGPHFVRCHSLV